jgi:Spermine/spermidine synthase domain
MAKRPKEQKQARSNADPPASATRASILSNPSFHKGLQLITLAAIYSPISLLSLTPVYGSVPSALYHNLGKYVACLIGFLGWKQLRKIFPSSIVKWLPVFAFWIPTFQFVLFKYSSIFGVPYGPVTTELLTYYPLALLSLFAAGSFLDEVDFSALGGTIAEHGPSIGSYFVFTTVERTAKSILLMNIGSNIALSRIGLQLMLAIIYALAIPKAVLWPIVPSLVFTMTHNVHNPLQRTTAVLNSTLQLHNFTLVDRQESITGYISVLDGTAAHYRIMRCDHSLLGGEWTFPPRKGMKPARAQEPIFGVFAMLEAVRLVETDDGQPRRPDSESTALNIGLGIGTAPAALITHGINTTIVELDPVVYKFAVKYFGLPSNHTPIIGDAVHLVHDAQARNITTRYDYIIHDVFTGGAEPVELFTQEFLSGLKYLLKEDGVIAIVRSTTPFTHEKLHAFLPRALLPRALPSPCPSFYVSFLPRALPSSG